MKNMADLDPSEQKLLAEALFETANYDYFEQDVEFEDEGQLKNHIPNSKIQFPIRRRRSKLLFKLGCFVFVLAFICATLVGVYFLLKSKNLSLDLKLAPGQTLRYKFEQESIYEGVKPVRSSFSEDVFVHVVNKTSNRYWLEVKINSLPSSGNQTFLFLVLVNLDQQKTKDFGEERFTLFTSRKSSSEMGFYIYNFLCQLLPVVKIDLFEILLSQITTRTREVTVEDSVLFPGIATMQQNIRTSDDQIFITSKINPEGFGAVESSKTRPPCVEMTFEEDVSICKASGMLKSSDVDLFAKIPFGENFESNPGITMKFKSSLRLVEEISARPKSTRMRSNENFVRLPRPKSKGAARLRYFSPLEKKYDEASNVVEKVKGMLNLTSFNTHGASLNEDMIEFSKSFHKVMESGQEVNFAAVEESLKKKGTLGSGDEDQKWNRPQTRKHGSGHGWLGNNADLQLHDDDDDDENDDDDERDVIDDDEAPNDVGRNDDDDQWNNRSGLAVPLYPDDSDSNEDEDERYRGPEGNEEEDIAPGKQNGYDDDDDEPVEKTVNKHSAIDEPKNKPKTTKASTQTSPDDDVLTEQRTSELRNVDEKDSLKPNSRFEHGSSVVKTPRENKNKPTRKLTNATDIKSRGAGTIGPSKLLTNIPTKIEQRKTNAANSSSTTTDSPNREQNLFSNVFGRLWHDDDDDDEGDSDHDNEFKFPPPIPFTVSSQFPFLHFRWPSFDDRKKRRSLETKPQSRKPRDVGHRDKRRLFGRGAEKATKRPRYTGKDLEMVWDVISNAKINARPKKTTHIFKQRVMGLTIKGDLEHEVLVVTKKHKRTEWVINLSLLLSVGEHRFKVLHKTYTMQEIKERFIKHTKPKLEYGTVHGGTLVLCSPLFYIENICTEIQLGFLLHVSHTIEHISKFPVELSMFFKHLTKVDAVVSSHMSTLLGSSGVFGHGPLFGAKVPLGVKFSEGRSEEKWCSVASLKSKIGHFYEKRNEMSQWSCSLDEATKPKSNCTGLDGNIAHKATRLWYTNGQSKKLHFLNNC